MTVIELPELSETVIANILEIVSDGVWDWNVASGRVYRSPGWYKTLGYEIDSLANDINSWIDLIHKDDFIRVKKHLQSYISHNSPNYSIQYRFKTKFNNFIWVEDRGRIISLNSDGSVARMIGAFRSIEEKKQLEDYLSNQEHKIQKAVSQRTSELQTSNDELSIRAEASEKQAGTDSLTNIANRYFFEQAIRLEIAKAMRFNTPLCLVLFDLDKFKQVNDLKGHAAGDSVLTKVADVLHENTRQTDLCARWGGDEFVILLSNTDMNEANIFAEKLRRHISNHMKQIGVNVTASFGITQYKKYDDVLSIVKKADKALYQSKKLGGDEISLN